MTAAVVIFCFSLVLLFGLVAWYINEKGWDKTQQAAKLNIYIESEEFREWFYRDKTQDWRLYIDNDDSDSSADSAPTDRSVSVHSVNSSNRPWPVSYNPGSGLKIAERYRERKN